jgi:hypothetical protein
MRRCASSDRPAGQGDHHRARDKSRRLYRRALGCGDNPAGLVGPNARCGPRPADRATVPRRPTAGRSSDEHPAIAPPLLRPDVFRRRRARMGLPPAHQQPAPPDGGGSWAPDSIGQNFLRDAALRARSGRHRHFHRGSDRDLLCVLPRARAVTADCDDAGQRGVCRARDRAGVALPFGAQRSASAPPARG